MKLFGSLPPFPLDPFPAPSGLASIICTFRAASASSSSSFTHPAPPHPPLKQSFLSCLPNDLVCYRCPLPNAKLSAAPHLRCLLLFCMKPSALHDFAHIPTTFLIFALVSCPSRKLGLVYVGLFDWSCMQWW